MKKRVLLVENDDAFRSTVEDLLKRLGYEVVSASVPAEALAHVERHNVDAAIIDVRLRDEEDTEDWSGLVLARDVADRGVPVIILSAYDTWEDVERAFDVAPGMEKPYAFVSKNTTDWEKRLAAELKDALSARRGGLGKYFAVIYQYIQGWRAIVVNLITNFITERILGKR